MGGHEVDVLRGGKLCRADEVPLVLPVGVVGAEDHLALAQVLQGLFNGVVLKHGVIPFPAQKPQRVKKSRVIPEGGGASAWRGWRSFSTYFPRTSVSKFTGSPTRRWARVVTETVWGMAEMAKDWPSTLATVRLMPSMAMEPFSTT